MTQNVLELTEPDDWHLHLRDGDALAHTVPTTSRLFARAIIMPNLKPPVEKVAQASNYRNRILAHVPRGRNFEPLMTLYLTDRTTVEDIAEAAASRFVHACKLYPAGATTHSSAGVKDLEGLYPVFERMQELGLPLLIHGEVTAGDVDIFDREARFLERHVVPLCQTFTQLRMVLEHITTRDAVEYVQEGPVHLGATITPQHLLFNRNDMLVGGIRPHLYCLPILKARVHQHALREAAVSGSPKFFLGTDSAPHLRNAKESACGCAGCYSAPFAMELYAEAFDQMGAMDRLEGFASHFGADFYGLSRNTGRICLERQGTEVPERLDFSGGDIVPLHAGGQLAWRVTRARVAV